MRIVKKNGFTLAELIVTIALIAIAATIIGVSLSGVMSNQKESKNTAFDKRIENLAKNYVYSLAFKNHLNEFYITLDDMIENCKEDNGPEYCKITTKNMTDSNYITDEEITDGDNTVSKVYWIYWEKENNNYVQKIKELKEDETSPTIIQILTFDDLKVGDYLELPFPKLTNYSTGNYVNNFTGHYNKWRVYSKDSSYIRLIPDSSVVKNINIKYEYCDFYDPALKEYADSITGGIFSTEIIDHGTIEDIEPNSIIDLALSDEFWVSGPTVNDEHGYCEFDFLRPNPIDPHNIGSERIYSGESSDQRFYFIVGISKSDNINIRGGNGTSIDPYVIIKR